MEEQSVRMRGGVHDFRLVDQGAAETPEHIPELTVRVRALYRDWRDEYATGKLIEAAAAKVTAMRQAMEEGSENPEDVYEVYRQLKREQVTQQVNHRRLHGGKMQELRAMKPAAPLPPAEFMLKQS